MGLKKLAAFQTEMKQKLAEVDKKGEAATTERMKEALIKREQKSVNHALKKGISGSPPKYENAGLEIEKEIKPSEPKFGEG